MHSTIEAVIEALEEALPCGFVEVAPGRRSAVFEGSGTHLDLDEEARMLVLSTPVAGAHDGLPAEDLLDLLAFNVPNDLTRGSFLAQGGAAGHLGLTDALPFQGLRPDVAVRAVLDQIAAALALGEHLVQRRAGRLAHREDTHAH